jgi:hypothetical protein
MRADEPHTHNEWPLIRALTLLLADYCDEWSGPSWKLFKALNRLGKPLGLSNLPDWPKNVESLGSMIGQRKRRLEGSGIYISPLRSYFSRGWTISRGVKANRLTDLSKVAASICELSGGEVCAAFLVGSTGPTCNRIHHETGDMGYCPRDGRMRPARVVARNLPP